MDRITIVSKRYCDVEACFEFIDSFFTGEGINLYLKKMTGKDIGIIQAYIGKVLFSRYEAIKFCGFPFGVLGKSFVPSVEIT